MSEDELRDWIAAQRLRGLLFVERKLDALCTDLGMDPGEAWRKPRWLEMRAREARIELRAFGYYASVLTPSEVRQAFAINPT